MFVVSQVVRLLLCLQFKSLGVYILVVLFHTVFIRLIINSKNVLIPTFKGTLKYPTFKYCNNSSVLKITAQPLSCSTGCQRGNKIVAQRTKGDSGTFVNIRYYFFSFFTFAIFRN